MFKLRHAAYLCSLSLKALVDFQQATLPGIVKHRVNDCESNLKPRVKLAFADCVAWFRPAIKSSNLVDSASSHTLVSKIKPCMSKYKSFTLKLRTAHYISYSLFDSPLLLG